jgi:hypothetical protein
MRLAAEQQHWLSAAISLWALEYECLSRIGKPDGPLKIFR